MRRKAEDIMVKETPDDLNTGKFKALIENAFDGIVLYDANGVIQYASPSIKNFFGFTAHDLVGRKGTDFVFHKDVDGARDAFYKVLMLPGKSSTHIQRFVTKKGVIRWSEYTLTNLLHNEDVRGVVSNFRDIHEKKIAEEKANQSQQLLNTISDNIVDGIFFGVPGKEFQYVNKGFLEITGYKSLEELNKIKPHHLYVQVDRWNEINTLLKNQGSVKNQQALLRKKNGTHFWGIVSITVFEDKKKNKCFAGSVQDITRQKEAEEKLQKSELMLSAISRNITEGIYRSIPGKGFAYVNRGFLELFGYHSLQELNASVKPGQLYADKKHLKFVRGQIAKHGEIRNVEVLFKRKNGQKFWGSMSSIQIRESTGAEFFDGAIRDITKQKEAEQQLSESRNFLDNVMRTVAAPIFVKDSKHRWVMFNDAFCWFMDKTRKELLGKTDHDFLSKDESKEYWKIDNQVLRTGDVVLNREKITLKNKSVKHLLTVKSRYINDRGEKFVIGFITDITEIKKREEQINKLNANLLGVMESTQESIYAIDRNFRYIAFNKNHARMSKLIYNTTISIGDNTLSFLKGTSEYTWLRAELNKALKGQHFVSEHRVNQPRYKDKFIETTYNPIFGKKNMVTGVAVFVRDITEMKLAQEAIRQSNATLTGVIESTKDRIVAIDKHFRYLMFNKSHALRMKRLTGVEVKVGDDFIKLLPKEISSTARKQLVKAFKGDPSTFELKILDQHLEAAVNPIKNDQGKVIAATLFVRDITHRKKTEEKLRVLNEGLTSQNWQLAAQEEELKATLEELSDRNFELDQLMYKTSHDLRSPLSSILGLVNLAHLDGNPENHLVYLNKIEGRIKKLDEFIKSMLNYARVNRSEIFYEPIQLRELIESCVQELEYLENYSTMKIIFSVKNENAVFKSDPLRVKIIAGNIISNAYKYYNPAVSSYLKITARITPLVTEIIFKDNGIGIKKEYAGKIFDMFYRATEKSQGSGLGMYIVKQAVDKLKGTIHVKSTFGKGTTIKIMIPNQ